MGSKTNCEFRVQNFEQGGSRATVTTDQSPTNLPIISYSALRGARTERMQLSGLTGCVGQLRRSFVRTNFADKGPYNARIYKQAILSGISGQGLSYLPDHQASRNSLSPHAEQFTDSRCRRRLLPGKKWGTDSCLRPFSSKNSPKTETAAHAETGMQSLKQELIETNEKEETISDSKKMLCEFVLQAFFNYLSVSAVAMAVANSGGDAVLQTILVMAAHFIILPLTICAGMEISGAHFNPVVTSCFVLVGKLSAKLGLGYILAQLAGGVLGAAAAFSSLPKSMQTLSHAGLQSVPPGSTIQQAFVGEMCAAFALILVLFSTNIDPRSQWGRLKPLSIPMIVCLLMWLVGPVSSMCINPARAFGPAVVTGFWENHWIWWTAPFIGGLSAAKIYHSVFMPPKLR